MTTTTGRPEIGGTISTAIGTLRLNELDRYAATVRTSRADAVRSLLDQALAAAAWTELRNAGIDLATTTYENSVGYLIPGRGLIGETLDRDAWITLDTDGHETYHGPDLRAAISALPAADGEQD